MDLVNDGHLDWAEWISLTEFEGQQIAVLGWEPTTFFEAKLPNAGHLLVRWLSAPDGYQFPDHVEPNEMEAVGSRLVLSSRDTKWVIADAIEPEADHLKLEVEAHQISIQTLIYEPSKHAKFIIHLVST